MNLHTDIKIFWETIRAASQKLKIKEEFIEKDYWITLVLNRLAKSKYAKESVFKGGTSLSKGFGLIDRFSEDVDIAIIDGNNKTGSEIKKIIRTIEKEITKELIESKINGITSKGSRFRKSVFEYVNTDLKNKNNKLIVEVNSFANPYPFQQITIKSFVYDFLNQTDKEQLIGKYNLFPFEINVLNKEQTLMEKLVSLIRFSFEENYADSISGKIRHFYDLFFLMKNKDCYSFVNSKEFKKNFNKILDHDREIFDEPKGWNSKSLSESPLINNFDNLWIKLRDKYKTELSALAYTPIPKEKDIAKSFKELLKLIQ